MHPEVRGKVAPRNPQLVPMRPAVLTEHRQAPAALVIQHTLERRERRTRERAYAPTSARRRDLLLPFRRPGSSAATEVLLPTRVQGIGNCSERLLALEDPTLKAASWRRLVTSGAAHELLRLRLHGGREGIPHGPCSDPVVNKVADYVVVRRRSLAVVDVCEREPPVGREGRHSAVDR
eukprot:3327930-Prymnesium_polylepis.1